MIQKYDFIIFVKPLSQIDHADFELSSVWRSGDYSKLKRRNEGRTGKGQGFTAIVFEQNSKCRVRRFCIFIHS